MFRNKTSLSSKLQKKEIIRLAELMLLGSPKELHIFVNYLC